MKLYALFLGILLTGYLLPAYCAKKEQPKHTGTIIKSNQEKKYENLRVTIVETEDGPHAQVEEKSPAGTIMRKTLPLTDKTCTEIESPDIMLKLAEGHGYFTFKADKTNKYYVCVYKKAQMAAPIKRKKGVK